jgi:tellurite resistance protein TerC
MIAGATWLWWAGFHAAVVALLAADAALATRFRRSARLACLWTALLVLAATLFAVWIAIACGRQTALEFTTGYAIEGSLSLDNLVVFLVLFRSFGADAARQHKALLWGIGGAIVLRALFIAAGVTLLNRFSWVSWIFGLVLLHAAWRMLAGGSAHAALPKWFERLRPTADSSRRVVPLFWLILAVEAADLIFATDSVPAVLAISHNPFVVYTSNIAAILGLRSLYFVLVPLLSRLRRLHLGFAVLLAFIALQMVASPWLKLPITVSLAVVAVVLAATALDSAIAGAKDRQSRREVL